MNKKEKAARKESFREMDLPQKADYILTYYKIPIIAVILAVIALFSFVHRQLTKKETLLYAGFINVSIGEDLGAALDGEYFREAGIDPKKNEIIRYEALYLSDDADTLNHQYAYASKTKITAAIADKTLDLVFMNREGYDILSRAGYLLELEPLIQENDPALYGTASPYLTQNEVITEDNSIEYTLNEASELVINTEFQTNALSVGGLPVFSSAGFNGDVFIGVIANTPRTQNVTAYLRWLLREGTV